MSIKPETVAAMAGHSLALRFNMVGRLSVVCTPRPVPGAYHYFAEIDGIGIYATRMDINNPKRKTVNNIIRKMRHEVPGFLRDFPLLLAEINAKLGDCMLMGYSNAPHPTFANFSFIVRPVNKFDFIERCNRHFVRLDRTAENYIEYTEGSYRFSLDAYRNAPARWDEGF